MAGKNDAGRHHAASFVCCQLSKVQQTAFSEYFTYKRYLGKTCILVLYCITAYQVQV